MTKRILTARPADVLALRADRVDFAAESVVNEQEVAALRNENQMLQAQIDKMREVYSNRSLTFTDLVLDGLNMAARVAGNPDDPRSQIMGARIDSLRVALGLPPRPLMAKPEPMD